MKKMTFKQITRNKMECQVAIIEELYNLYKESPELTDPEYGGLTQYGRSFQLIEDDGEHHFLWEMMTEDSSTEEEFRFYINEVLAITNIKFTYSKDGITQILTLGLVKKRVMSSVCYLFRRLSFKEVA